MRRHIQSNFNGGEWSPLMDSRVQLAKYSTSLRKMTNFFPTIYGNARKRQGLEFLDLCLNQPTKSRLEAFRFNNDARFILEFGHNLIRFWQNGAIVSGADVVSTYTEAQLPLLRFQAINDVVFIVHPEHPVRQLARTATTTWVLSEYSFTNEPFDESVTQTIALTANSGANTITAASALFDADDVGKKIQLLHTVADDPDSADHRDAYNASADANLSSTSRSIGDKIRYNNRLYTCILAYNNGTDYVATKDDPADYPTFFAIGVELLAPVKVEATWEFETGGIWTGVVKVQTSDNGTSGWQTLHTVSSAENNNAIRTGDESSAPSYLRVVVDEADTSKGEGTMKLTRLGYERDQVATIDTFTSSTVVGVTFEDSDVIETATSRWSFNEWNAENGYPSQVVLHDNRLYLAGTTASPQKVWGSEVDNYLNFKPGTNDADPLRFTIASGNQDPIRFMQVQKILLIGTARSIWGVASEEDRVIKPSSIRVKRQSGRGAAAVPAIAVDDSCIYVQEGKRNIREAINSYERGGYVSNALNLLAEHLTQGNVAYMAHQQNRESIIWMVLENGGLVCCTYEKDQDVIGWFRIETAGEVESIAILPTDGEEDEVWISVKRSINGADARYVERLKPNQYRVQDEGQIADCFFVDSGIVYDGVSATQITGLDHLEGEEVAILNEGSVVSRKTVSGGFITLDSATTKAAIGLPYEAVMQTQRAEMITSQGTAQGKEVRIHKVVFDLYQSLSVKFGPTLDKANDVVKLGDSNEVGETLQLSSGISRNSLDVGYKLNSAVVLKSDLPLPCTVRALIWKFKVSRDND